MNIMV